MYQLGRAKGYSLVYAERSGHYLFFIRDEVLREKNLVFKQMNQPQALHKNFQLPGEIFPDQKQREYISSSQLLK
jgi:hypothetical protein